MQDLQALENHILRASSPYVQDAHHAEARRLAKQIASRCPDRFCRFATLLVQRLTSEISTSDFVRSLDVPDVLGEESDYLALKVLGYCAMYSHGDPGDQHGLNRQYRGRCLRLAEKLGSLISQLVILTNWVSAALSDDDVDLVEGLLGRIDILLDNPTLAEHQNAKRAETDARHLSHHAKLKFLKARDASTDEASKLVNDGVVHYRAAAARIAEQDHLRVKMQIEAANHLARLGIDRDDLDLLGEARNFLALALRALDSHVSNACRAYYHTASARGLELEALRIHNVDLKLAIPILRQAVSEREACVAAYRAEKHHLEAEAAAELENTRRWLEQMTKPKKIFLSHRTADKDRVRIFAKALRSLGFDPWLDEEALPSSKPVERTLLAGMNESCAAVFFVTENFIDEGFLSTEIDYALLRRRKLEKVGEEFAIIVLVVEAEVGSIAVPEILQTHRHSSHYTELEAFEALICALPVRTGTVLWRKSDPQMPA